MLSLSALGHENDFSRAVIRFWIDTRQVDIEPELAGALESVRIATPKDPMQMAGELQKGRLR
jgi:hypothetical protein